MLSALSRKSVRAGGRREQAGSIQRARCRPGVERRIRLRLFAFGRERVIRGSALRAHAAASAIAVSTVDFPVPFSPIKYVTFGCSSRPSTSAATAGRSHGCPVRSATGSGTSIARLMKASATPLKITGRPRNRRLRQNQTMAPEVAVSGDGGAALLTSAARCWCRDAAGRRALRNPAGAPPGQQSTDGQGRSVRGRAAGCSTATRTITTRWASVVAAAVPGSRPSGGVWFVSNREEGRVWLWCWRAGGAPGDRVRRS